MAGASLLGAIAQVTLAVIVPAHLVVAALALGYTIGLTGAAVPLVIVTRRIRGAEAVQGTGRAMLAGLGAAVAGVLVGVAVSVSLPASGKLMDAATAAMALFCAIAVFGGVAYVLDDGDLKVVMARLLRVARLRPPTPVPATGLQPPEAAADEGADPEAAAAAEAAAGAYLEVSSSGGQGYGGQGRSAGPPDA